MKKEKLIKEVLGDIYDKIINSNIDMLAYLRLTKNKESLIVEYKTSFEKEGLIISFFDIGFQNKEDFIKDYTPIIINKLFK